MQLIAVRRENKCENIKYCVCAIKKDKWQIKTSHKNMKSAFFQHIPNEWLYLTKKSCSFVILISLSAHKMNIVCAIFFYPRTHTHEKCIWIILFAMCNSWNNKKHPFNMLFNNKNNLKITQQKMNSNWLLFSCNSFSPLSLFALFYCYCIAQWISPPVCVSDPPS